MPPFPFASGGLKRPFPWPRRVETSEAPSGTESLPTINDHQWSSNTVNQHQVSSMIINHHRSSSIIINHHQSSSIAINCHQLSSIISILVSLWFLVPVPCQFLNPLLTPQRQPLRHQLGAIQPPHGDAMPMLCSHHQGCPGPRWRRPRVVVQFGPQRCAKEELSAASLNVCACACLCVCVSYLP